EFKPLDFLEEIERTQRRCRAHRGIGQHEYRDDRALLIFLHEVQAEIDQRQKNKVGEKPIGVAQKFHACAPIDSRPGSLARYLRECGSPAGIAGLNATSVDVRQHCYSEAARPVQHRKPVPACSNCVCPATALRHAVTSRFWAGTAPCAIFWCARRMSRKSNISWGYTKGAGENAL